ncbi:hypothetical protein KIH75_03440 [Bifidobacterium sp. 64T4]|uniref:hypothetical protein n=1 Tax=Bifidobacterium pongonis TaxID=2834432 RepID=UPI001C59696B|nr:hypothetical protein [Bifidobacterium pongonis]MBW3094416.1 hypothetical protein [Bifidobacterium pongonis]
MSETVEKRGAGCARMLGVQAAAYAVFIVVALLLSAIGGPMSRMVVYGLAAVALVVLVAFHVCWPFRAGLADRIIGVVAGLLSLVFVSTTLGEKLVPSNEKIMNDELLRNTYPMMCWAAAVAGLLVLLTVVSFGRQMLREERSHLIRALSHCVTGGAASISLAGWVFLPYVVVTGQFAGSKAITGKFVALVVAMVVVALLLAYASVFWMKELDPAEDAREPWIGVAMLPVMLFGLVVFAAALLVQIVGW